MGLKENFTWSHTSLKEFEQCPRKFHACRVLKLYPFKETEATQYGNEVHKAIELYIKRDKPLGGHERFKAVVDAMCAKPGRKLAEYKMGIRRDLTACDFFDTDVWARGVGDILVVDDEDLVAWVADWKTGNNKYPDYDQLVLMALMVFAHFPHVRKVRAALIFLLKDDVKTAVVTREEAEKHWWKYRERTGRIEAALKADVWNPKQGPLCGWCEHTACELHPKH